MSVNPAPSTDEERLAQLGYQQELHRRLSGFSNFAVSFSIISILAGAITSYGIAMAAGGPLAITLGWLFVGIMVTLVALAMAEVCSAYPTAGALYWWAAALAKRNKAGLGVVRRLVQLPRRGRRHRGHRLRCGDHHRGLPRPDLRHDGRQVPDFLIFLVIIVVHGLLNTFGVSLVRLLSDVSAWWHLVGVAVIVVRAGGRCRTTTSRSPRSSSRSRTRPASPSPAPGVYAVLLGLLMAQYTYTGYDASAHVAEETHDAARAAPRGIVMSVVVSVIAGFVLLFAITWSIQDYEAERTTALGLPPAQIFIDAAGHNAGTFLVFICMVAQWFCGMASVTANSRMSYAFSRDGALPGSRIWKKVNPRTGTPTNSIWLCVAMSIDPGAAVAVEHHGVPGGHLDRGDRPLHRVRRAGLPAAAATRTSWPGPWNLGRWSALVGWAAIVWVVIICVLFVLPTAEPDHGDDVQLHDRRRGGRASAPRRSGGSPAPGSWFTGPRQNLIEKAAQGEQTMPTED